MEVVATRFLFRRTCENGSFSVRDESFSIECLIKYSFIKYSNRLLVLFSRITR